MKTEAIENAGEKKELTPKDIVKEVINTILYFGRLCLQPF